jgi:rare lipoprotein A
LINKIVVITAIATAVSLGSMTPSMAQRAKTQAGMASVYSTESGNKTASGQRLNPGGLTAAHRSLPFGTKVRVTNKRNGRSVVVTINDRGPFVRGRIIDLTPASARAIGLGWSVAPVRIDVLG